MQWREKRDPRTVVVLVGWPNTTTWSMMKREKLQLSDIGGKKLEINRDKNFFSCGIRAVAGGPRLPIIERQMRFDYTDIPAHNHVSFYVFLKKD